MLLSQRPTWDEYFMQIAVLTSHRSNCIKRKVGAIIVKDNRILSLGYNGTPKGMVNCYEGGCSRCCNSDLPSGSHLDLCLCLHAEENALLYISKEDLKNSTMYVTLLPCISCTKKILQCDISRVVYKDQYSPQLDQMSESLLASKGVIIEKMIEKIVN